jgi:hypothetical protein
VVYGDIKQGFVTASQIRRHPTVIHGSGASGSGGGSTFVDSFFPAPSALSGQPLVDRLDQPCPNLDLDVDIPGSPVEIDALSRLSSLPALPTGVPVVCLTSQYRDDGHLSAMPLSGIPSAD